MIVENFSPSESSSCRTFLLFLFHPEIILSLLLTMKAACYDNRDTIPRVQCEYYCRLVEKRKKKKKREIGFFFIPKTILSDTVRVLWRFFFLFTIFVTSTSRGKKKRNARRLLDRARGEHLNLKGPKFEVLSRAKEVRCPFYGSAFGSVFA